MSSNAPSVKGRRLDNQRPLGEVHEADEIDGIGVSREEKRFRIHQLREDDKRVVTSAGVDKALARGYQGGAPKSVQKYLGCVHEVEVVVDLFDGLFARRAVLEFEGPKPRLKLVWRADPLRDCGRRLRHCQVRECQNCECDSAQQHQEETARRPTLWHRIPLRNGPAGPIRQTQSHGVFPARRVAIPLAIPRLRSDHLPSDCPAIGQEYAGDGMAGATPSPRALVHAGPPGHRVSRGHPSDAAPCGSRSAASATERDCPAAAGSESGRSRHHPRSAGCWGTA